MSRCKECGHDDCCCPVGANDRQTIAALRKQVATLQAENDRLRILMDTAKSIEREHELLCEIDALQAQVERLESLLRERDRGRHEAYCVDSCGFLTGKC